jgi:uroporphyrinogen-III synthase
VYETIKTPKEIKKDYDGVLFFSPSAAESFFSINKIKSHTVCFAIGDTTATTLKKFTTNKIIQAQNQSQQSMMNAMLAHFKISIDE